MATLQRHALDSHPRRKFWVLIGQKPNFSLGLRVFLRGHM